MLLNFWVITFDCDAISPDSNGKLCEGKSYFFLGQKRRQRSPFFGIEKQLFTSKLAMDSWIGF
jgi:hypothetical protein